MLPFGRIVSALRGPETGFSVHIATTKKAFALVVKVARNADGKAAVLFVCGDGFLPVQDGSGLGNKGFSKICCLYDQRRKCGFHKTSAGHIFKNGGNPMSCPILIGAKELEVTIRVPV